MEIKIKRITSGRWWWKKLKYFVTIKFDSLDKILRGYSIEDISTYYQKSITEKQLQKEVDKKFPIIPGPWVLSKYFLLNIWEVDCEELSEIFLLYDSKVISFKGETTKPIESFYNLSIVPTPFKFLVNPHKKCLVKEEDKITLQDWIKENKK